MSYTPQSLPKVEPSVTLPLWPLRAPDSEPSETVETYIPANVGGESSLPLLQHVSTPRLEFYPAPLERNTGTTVIVAPGGSYFILAIEHEGTQVVEWLNSIGVNAVLLKYRVPCKSREERYHYAFQDAQRAMRLTRASADIWGINPDRIGMLGFSAGAHLALNLASNHALDRYDPIDATDSLSSRPDFIIPIYPAFLVDQKEDTGVLPPEIRIDSNFPPAFFVHAHTDEYSAIGSARCYIAMKQAGVSAELHIYREGGHGFGILPDRGPISDWPERCYEWMNGIGLI